jgi:hypothetical protein
LLMERRVVDGNLIWVDSHYGTIFLMHTRNLVGILPAQTIEEIIVNLRQFRRGTEFRAWDMTKRVVEYAVDYVVGREDSSE